MKLIINADDFGYSKSINKGILEGIQTGFITSTSIMMNMEFTNHAINLIKEEKLDCVGIHLNITKGRATLSGLKYIVDEKGNFKTMEDILKYTDVTEVRDELENQIMKFRMLGLKPTHLDFHKAIFKNPLILSVIFDLSIKYALPLRIDTRHIKRICGFKNINTTDYLYKTFYKNGVSLDTINEIIAKHKDTNDIVEIMTHAGYLDEYTKNNTSYLLREEELKILKKAKEENVFEGIEMISYKNIKRR